MSPFEKSLLLVTLKCQLQIENAAYEALSKESDTLSGMSTSRLAIGGKLSEIRRQIAILENPIQKTAEEILSECHATLSKLVEDEERWGSTDWTDLSNLLSKMKIDGTNS